MEYFRMYSEPLVFEYMRPGLELGEIAADCANSEFQFLDKAPLEVSLADDSGLEFPDFIIYRGCVPLISENFRQLLESAGVDNLFYKRIILLDKETGINQKCWLALPPRIECLDFDESEVEMEESEWLPPREWTGEAKKIVINPYRTGNYQIFKLDPCLSNQEIIVTEKLKAFLEGQNLENVYFADL